MIAPIRRGARLHHRAFGPGTVRSLDGEHVVIAFDDHGEKKLLLSIASAMLSHSAAVAPAPAPPHKKVFRKPKCAAAPAAKVPAPKPTDNDCQISLEPKPAPTPRKSRPPRPLRPLRHCNQCDADWRPYNDKPRVCGRCNSRFWNESESDTEARHQAGSPKRIYQEAPEIDAAIRRAYEEYVAGDRQAIKRAALAARWPRWRFIRRAAALGLSRVKELPWSGIEDRLLEQWVRFTPVVIARKLTEQGFHRTEAAVSIRIRLRGIREQRGGYSVYKLSLAFGVDGHTVQRWVDAGLLPAERLGTDRTAQQGGDSQFIHHSDVKAFVFAHAEEIDLRKVDKFWFLDLVTDGQITDRQKVA